MNNHFAMCHYQTLYYHEVNGYIVRCPACKHIQIAYNSLLLTFESTAFTGFCRCVQRAYDDFETGMASDVKSVVVPTPCEGVKLFLSYNELSFFNEMMQTAAVEMETQQLLALFK